MGCFVAPVLASLFSRYYKRQKWGRAHNEVGLFEKIEQSVAVVILLCPSVSLSGITGREQEWGIRPWEAYLGIARACEQGGLSNLLRVGSLLRLRAPICRLGKGR